MTTLTCAGDTKPKWKISEDKGFVFIKSILPVGWYAELQGGSDSTISDIFIYNEKREFLFAIEIKQLPSAGGMQFVVEYVNGVFVSINKNSCVPGVLEIINSATSRAKNISLNETTRPIVEDCLIENLAAKNVKLMLITNATNSYFKLISVENLFEEVNVNLHFPRPKKSGSQDFPKALLSEARIQVTKHFGVDTLVFYPHRDKAKKTMVNVPASNQFGSKKGIYLDEHLYLGSRDSTNSRTHYTYELRKVSSKSHDEIKPTVIINLTKANRSTKQSKQELHSLLMNAR